MRIYSSISIVVICSLFCNCFLNPSPTVVHQTDFATLGFEVAETIDHGEFSKVIEDIWPFELADNHFYLIESPEDLDSIFQPISYCHLYSGPGLEDLFPENGMLLLYFDTVWSSTAYIDHKISFSADTISIDVSLTENPDLKSGDKGIYYLIIPIGVIPE